MRVRGLKPLPAVWLITWLTSHPMRVRGLKLRGVRRGRLGDGVAPYAGAWIETGKSTSLRNFEPSHPMRVRGLKPFRRDESQL